MATIQYVAGEWEPADRCGHSYQRRWLCPSSSLPGVSVAATVAPKLDGTFPWRVFSPFDGAPQDALIRGTADTQQDAMNQADSALTNGRTA